MNTPAHLGQSGEDARDKSLLRRAQRGEASALAELMRHHLLPAWRLCLTLTLERDDAESLLVEVTRSLWSDALAKGPGLDALGAITRLARSRAAMTVRRRCGEQGAPIVLLRPDGRQWGEASPYDAAYEQQLLAVYASWASEDRLLFALRAFERLPQADVSRVLELPLCETVERMAMLRVRIEASMRGEEPASVSGEHLSPILLSASLDGTFAGALKDDGHELVTRHLSACTSCRDLSVRLRRHEEGLRRLLAFDPGEAYLQDLGHYLDQLIDAVSKGRHLPLRRVRAEVIEPEPPATLAAAPLPTPPTEAATPPTPTAPAPDVEDVHHTLDALMAELGKGFATPRAVTRAPVEPPRTAADVLKPPSREIPRPASTEMPRPAPPVAVPSESGEHARPTPSSARLSTDLDATIILAHRRPEPPPARAPEPSIEPVITSAVKPEPEPVQLAPLRRSAGPVTSERRSPPRVLVLSLAGALIVVLALYALPPVITVSVPEMPSPRLPRIELVRATADDGAATARDVAASANSPAPAAARVDVEPKRASTPSRQPAKELKQPEVVRTKPQPPPPPAQREAQPQHSATTAAPRTATQIIATPATVRAEALVPAVAPATDAEEDWPLLCGEVRDDAGEPVAGARVLLADLDLGARTDRRGRFCIAAPIGDRTLTVTAQGFATLRRLVSLGRQTAELTLQLKAGPSAP